METTKFIDARAPLPRTVSDSEDEALYGYDPEAYYVAHFFLRLHMYI